MISCHYIGLFFMRNIFLKVQVHWLVAYICLRSLFCNLCHLWYIQYCSSARHRSKWATPALLRPFTTMKSQIKTSTNHGTVFQLPPDHNTPSSGQNATAWRSWQPFSIACCLGLFAVDLSLSVTSQDNTNHYARIWLHARLHHKVLAMFCTLPLVVMQFVFIVECVILSVVL